MEYAGGKTNPASDDVIYTEEEQALRISNAVYAGLFLLMAIFAFVLKNTGHTWLGRLVNTEHSDPAKIGTSLVSRTTAALFVFFGVHAVVTVGNDNEESSWKFRFHTEFIYIHVLAFLVLWIGFWFIPDGLFDVFTYLSIYLAGIYLTLQIMFLVMYFHDINLQITSESDNYTLIVSIIAVCYVGIIGASGACYHFYVEPGCTQNTVIISCNIAAIVVLLVLAIVIPHGSILTSCLVAGYSTYVMAMGFQCSDSCNILYTGKSNMFFTIMSSSMSVLWLGMSAFSATNKFVYCDCNEEENSEKPKFSLSFFHTIFSLAAAYLGMVVTNWGQTSVDIEWSTGRGNIARWSNLIASWLTYVTYLWALLAPLLLKDRVFEHEIEAV